MTHVLAELKKYAFYALRYLDKALELHSRSHLGNRVSRNTFTSKRQLNKFFSGLQLNSCREITSKLLLALETGVILMIALYEDIVEGQYKK
jgi:hypothetical protein